jgi:hypothetical protein
MRTVGIPPRVAADVVTFIKKRCLSARGSADWLQPEHRPLSLGGIPDDQIDLLPKGREGILNLVKGGGGVQVQ